MLSLPLLILFLSLPAGGRAESTPEPDEDDPRWCTTCHREQKYSKVEQAKTVHADLGCRDCHLGYQFNPHEPVEEPSEESLNGLDKLKVGNAAPLAACAECHNSIVEEFTASAHGKALFTDKREDAPYCVQCHGDPHAIVMQSKLPASERRQAMSARCASCHEDRARVKPHVDEAGKEGGEHRPVVMTYDLSMHGRKLFLGSNRAPGCADCHGAHELKDLKAVGGETCGKCHTGATNQFTGAFNHEEEGLKDGEDKVGYYTKKFFGWLTFLTILFLCIHVLLDLSARLRQRTKHAVMSHLGTPPPAGFVQRFDIHQRLQHGMMALSFTTLVLTGWPLSTHNLGPSSDLMAIFGGPDRCGVIHRVAGVTMLVCGVYHLLYVLVLILKGRLTLAMLPGPKDLKDLVDNLRMFFNPTGPRPRFPRYSYFEKFDYWAVFWGVAILGGSGLVLWFPVWVGNNLPSWVFPIVRVAHADEAILALLAIFLWHFYNVHLRPSVFPMSRVFIDGKMTFEALEEEHGAEYDALMAQRAAEAAKAAAPPAEGAKVEPPTGGK